MITFITKDINCTDPTKCDKIIQNKLKSIFPQLEFTVDNNNPNSHISIFHENKNHLIWLCMYEKDGEHLQSHSNIEQKGTKQYIATFKREHKDDSIKEFKTPKVQTIGIISTATIKTPNLKCKKCPITVTESQLSNAL
jgi:hypothetical protein